MALLGLEQAGMKFFYEVGYRFFRLPWEIGPRSELVQAVETGRVLPPPCTRPWPDPARRVALYELSLVLRIADGAVHSFSSYAAWLQGAGYAGIDRLPLGDEHGLVQIPARRVAELEPAV